MPEAEVRRERVVLNARATTGAQHGGTGALERQLKSLGVLPEQAGYEVLGETADAEDGAAEPQIE